MKLLSILLSLMTLAVILPFGSSSAIDPSADRTANPEGPSPSRRLHEAKSPKAAGQTNAERFAKGPPVRRGGSYSVPQTTYRVVIKVYEGPNKDFRGYVTPGRFDSFYTYVPTPEAAVHFRFALPTGQTSGEGIEVVAEDGTLLKSWQTPYIGLSAGRSLSLAAGSPAVAFLAGTSQTSPGSGPASGPPSGTSASSYPLSIGVESPVWTIDVTTGTMSVKWINDDGTAPSLGVFSSGTRIYYGDISVFGGEKYSPLTLKFELV